VLPMVWAKLTDLWSSKNRGFTVFGILCVLTLASAWLGLALEASVRGPAQVPVPPTITISFQPGSPAPLRISVNSFLEQIAGRPEVILTASGSFARQQKDSDWSVDVRGFTGYKCPGQPGVRTIRLPGEETHESYLSGRSALSGTPGADFFTVKLCWKSGAPLVTSGAYISAALPAVLAPLGQAGTVTRFLVLSNPPLSGYISSGGVPPTVASGQGWIWSSDVSEALDSQARFDIPVIASSLAGLQRDNRSAFYSGILFGIAGGGFVSLLPVLLDAVDRRNTRQKTGEASGQHSQSGDQHPPAGGGG
jgi:hypothetical protein